MAANGPNVSLTAGLQSGTNLPPELATKQMQLQVQQQLAEALLAKGMQNIEPVTHGPAGNPFARDTVNWGGILSNLANTLGGRSELEKIGPQQAAIAQQGEAMRKQDMAGVMQDIMGGSTPGPYEGGSINKPPSVVNAIARALASSSPPVQAQGQELQKAWIEGQMKGIPSSADTMSGARNLTAESIAAARTPGLFGMGLDPSKFVNKAIEVSGPAGAIGTLAPVPGAQVAPAGILQPPHQPVINPGDPLDGTSAGSHPVADTATVVTPEAPPPTGEQPASPSDIAAGKAPPGVPINNTGAHLTYNPDGTAKVLETPVTKLATEIANQKVKDLGEGKEKSQAFVEAIPKLSGILNLIGNSDLRWGGEQITKARQVAVSLGLSTDASNKIVDTQTFLKLTLPQAAENARSFNSRATQLEFVKFLDAAAANQNVDPRAARNIITQSLLDGVNANRQHENNIDSAATLPAVGKSQAETYRVKGFPTNDDIFLRMLKDVKGTPFGVVQDPKTGMLSNSLLGAGPKEPAAPPSVKWVYKDGKLVPNAANSP